MNYGWLRQYNRLTENKVISKMSKILYALLLSSLVSLGTSLKCFSCNSEDSCKNATSVICDDEENYCLSLELTQVQIYHRGCTTDKNYCKTENPTIYTQCNVCDSDECNTDKFM
ncbi:uncharacterized protein LOC123688926 [Harmonia axyridis]|uniref:uncharacterized protein LOC123688926 n=1 Tax=Harmonia axyridis TaxID=115357 RepID=UPI001E274DCF|nr:uncharacterized protein LOC123688926 [Harmonia axyridis]